MTAPEATRDPEPDLTGIPDGVDPPEVVHRDVVLVAGPWLAGASALAAALRARMPDRTFVETGDLAPDQAPSAVVFAVSAVAPLTESDAVLLDAAARHTDLVVGAVTKTDVHRGWRAVLAADRDAVAARSRRYAGMPWVGVAAAPEAGEPSLDELVDVLSERLADAAALHRNTLRAWETHLTARIGELSGAHRPDGRAVQLRAERDELLRAGRLQRSQRNIALRSQVQQARVQLGYFARNRCASVRTELSEDVADWNGRRAERLVSYVHRRCAEVVGEVDDGITEHLTDVATELGLPAPEVPPAAPVPDAGAPGLRSRTLETRLMMVLGAGFGLGAAFAVSRLFAGLAPGLTALGVAVGAVAGLLLTVWVIGIRSVLHDRAVVDRWVGEVTARLREATEQRVAHRVLMAEVRFTGEAAAQDERAAAALARRIQEIDAELADIAALTARSAAAGQRELPRLRTALARVCAGLESG
ncbi:hypothetical protein C1S82_31125 [Mycolicibacterium cosmeticum]|uniref:Uncharacterized protein n=1 Tax=Mycolicibacterium cosmeticum TaxID=258533 RepID=W9B0W5_MYCCO|nr:hypothetical protein [Mycolicibacterium cosmeticum]TLH65172.1 hypothetical protein C1S82_31125 [Mycolicibacterium cosmeticum]CDO08491.1 hypothetical protein BN977_03310 [Mycolicibacterium cosmeticum]